jgi:membrane dipeptidase
MFIFDGHNDTIKQAYMSGRNFLVRGDCGHIDLPRARQGNMKGGIFALQTPPELAEERAFGYGLTLDANGWEVRYAKALSQEYAAGFVNEVLRYFLQSIEGSNEVRVVRDFDGLQHCLESDIFAVVLHLEGAEAIREDLGNIEYYHDVGVRSLGLVWSRPNAFGYGVPFRFPGDPNTGPGLTTAGKKLVRKCNELGIIVDLTHITEAGFWDVAELSTAPLVVSHGNSNAICPSTTNLLDMQIDAVGKSRGVIGVNFDVLNVRRDGRLATDTTLDSVIEHIDHIRERIGKEHVAFGSDFDGGQMPATLDSVARLPELLDALSAHGYSDQDLEMIGHGNWLRVIRETWK